jgi:ankyrin repeat protein
MNDAKVDTPDAPRPLPTRANLEHLKNEAKQRLKSLRRQDPDTKLAAAQRAVARSYGFASWRKLKHYVDARHDAGEHLIEAVRTGKLEAMRAILRGNPDLANQTTHLERLLRPSDTLAMRLIHLAVAEDQMDAARLLIEHGADLNARNSDGRLPLHDCFELGRDELARFLLRSGAEPDVCAAAAYGMHDRLREILQRDPLQANDLQTGISPIGWSVYGNQPEAARILLDHGAVIDQPPYDAEAWRSTAHVANTILARVLLEHGANPNCRDQEGDTPMHAAIKSRLVGDPTEFVELLLAAGADPAILNKAGRTALDEAMLQIGKAAETYFPARSIGAKKLDRVIEWLRTHQGRS